jgi:branched-chain amino acid transport system permease protein
VTDRLLSFLVAGLSAGSLYALVALGLVLVHRSTRVLNFAHGELATLGTFVAFELASRGLPFPAALLAGGLAAAAVAIGFFYAVLVPAQRRGASPLALLITTLGLAQVVHAFVLWRWRAEPERFPFPIAETASVKLGPAVVSELSLASHTRFGLALRALSENVAAAQTLGIPSRPVLASAWALSAFLAVVAGVFLAAQVLLDPFFMLDPFLKGLAAATLGGLDSLPGAVAGGFLLGAAEALTGAAIGLEFKNSLAFVVIVLVLLVRPQGLLGREFKERV